MVYANGKGVGGLKITVHASTEEKEIKIDITCQSMTPEVGCMEGFGGTI